MPNKEIGAMPWFMEDDKLYVVLVTSSSGRWILPKGHPEPKLDDRDTAKLEAYEEAGVRTKRKKSRYVERVKRSSGPDLKIYTMQVDRLLKDWPESDQRKRCVMRWKKAVDRLDDAAMQRGVRRLARKLKSN